MQTKKLSARFNLWHLFTRPMMIDLRQASLIVLPNGVTKVIIELRGWGWLSVQTQEAPRPKLRLWFYSGSARLHITIPVGQLTTFVAHNFWGRVGRKLTVMPTMRREPYFRSSDALTHIPEHLHAVLSKDALLPMPGISLPNLPHCSAPTLEKSMLRPSHFKVNTDDAMENDWTKKAENS